MKERKHFNQWFNVFLAICEVLQGYESKTYWVSDYHMKLQLKKLSRTKDIQNFPTKGCDRIKIYTIF